MKQNKKDTRAALKGSIAKWKAIAAGVGADHGTTNCPLCTLFYKGESPDCCTGCPVYESSPQTRRYCDDTPYVAFRRLCQHSAADGDLDSTGGMTARSERAKYHARAELDFLRGLLPGNTP